MNNVKVKIWGRDFELPISYEMYSDKLVADNQKESVKLFILDMYANTKGLEEIKEYVEENSNQVKATEIDNIFKYVMPVALYVPRKEENMIAILCNYKFDMEHGVAVVFKDGVVNKVGAQDIIL